MSYVSYISIDISNTAYKIANNFQKSALLDQSWHVGGYAGYLATHFIEKLSKNSIQYGTKIGPLGTLGPFRAPPYGH